MMAGTVERWRRGEPVAPLRELLERGGVLAIPTESSYGLAADPWNRRGVEAIYRIKGRDRGKPLPVVMAGLEDVERLGIDPDLPILSRLARLWPAALTAVLPLAESVEPGPPAAAGERSLAVRVPERQDLLDLLRQLGPLTATSANPSGGEAVLDPEGAAALLEGFDAAVIDAGPLAGGPPSTLVRWGEQGLEILRPGRVSARALEELESSGLLTS